MTPQAAADVWLCDTRGATDDDVNALLRCLDAEETARAARFRRASSRREYVAAHALTRWALSRRAPSVAPSRWRFANAGGGKPHIEAPASPLRFNLSHTTGLVAVAVATGTEVGVDVERMNPARELLALAESHFAAEERAWVEAAGPEERVERFYTIWTLKESYLKVTGAGLAVPLDAFRLRVEGATASLQVDGERIAGPHGPFRFEHARRGEHAVAVATHARVGALWADVALGDLVEALHGR